jgi:hypothetical protein
LASHSHPDAVPIRHSRSRGESDRVFDYTHFDLTFISVGTITSQPAVALPVRR